MQTPETIGVKITEARKKIGLSQAQLAQHMSVSPQAVGKWERGESMPDILTFDRLAGVLGVDMNYFSENDRSSSITDSQNGPKQTDLPIKEQRQSLKPKWDMSSGNWVNADFSGLKNLGEKFGSANIKNCVFIGSELSGLILKGNDVGGNDFSDSDLENSHFDSSSIINCKFRECNLKESRFNGNHIKSCDFTSADLTGAVIQSSSFLKNTVTGVIWYKTAFRGTQLTETVIDGEMSDCSFENCSFSGVTFQNTVLINTFFKCRTLKKIKFIDCKADHLTYAFLKNGKANMDGISLITPQGGVEDDTK